MSTVTQKEHTTTQITTPPLINSSSSTAPSSSSAPSSTTTNTNTNTTTPSVTQQISDGLYSIGNSAAQAVKNLDDSLGVSKAVSDFDKTHHVSQGMGDATAHMSAALTRGNPIHAISHASTAARVGAAEAAKHEKGPLPDDAHIAPEASGTTNSTTTTTTSSTNIRTHDVVEPKEHTDYHPDPKQHKTSNQLGDMADHVKSSLAHGNVLHAAKYAGAAATIGEVEREKHEKGPLPEQLVDQPEAEHVNVPAGQVKHTV